MTTNTKEKQREYSKRYYQRHRSKWKDPEFLSKKNRLVKAWTIKNPERYLINKARDRARSKGLEFSITHEDIHIPECCPVLNIPLVRGEGSQHDSSPTLDRIDNTKGYIKGNVVVISALANNLKNSNTIETLELLLAFMRKHSC